MLSEIELKEKMSNTSTIALDNVMIAEFQKLETVKFVNSGILNYLFIDNRAGYSCWCEPHGLCYDTSWQFLMIVLDDILEVISKEDGDFDDFYEIRDCIPSLTDTYNAVVEFIKRYNNNKNG